MMDLILSFSKVINILYTGKNNLLTGNYYLFIGEYKNNTGNIFYYIGK